MEKTELLVSGSVHGDFTAFVNVFPRPAEFAKKSAYADDADEEESTIGKMPPQESDDES